MEWESFSTFGVIIIPRVAFGNSSVIKVSWKTRQRAKCIKRLKNPGPAWQRYVCIHIPNSHRHLRNINPVWRTALEMGLTLQSVIHTRRPLLAVTYHCANSGGQWSFCQILTAESIKRHSKSSIRTDTTNTTALWGPREVWNCFSMLISLHYPLGLSPLLAPVN